MVVLMVRLRMSQTYLEELQLDQKLKSTVSLFDTYDVKNGETPEIIADKLYDDPKLHWIIMLINNVTDRYHDCSNE